MRITRISAVALAAALIAAQAAPPARLPRENLLLRRDSAGAPAAVTSLTDWESRRREILDGVADVMGRLPGADKRCPLDMKVIAEVDCGTFVRRSIEYSSEPGCRTPAYLLIPKSALAGERRPAVLCLHPTDQQVGHGVVVGLGAGRYPPYGNELAQRGFVVLAPAYPLLAGYQPDIAALGWKSGSLKAVWDNIRGLDLLETLPFVSSGGFAAIGHSLGGHNAIFTAVHEPRIHTIVSSCGFDSFLDYYGGDPANWQSGKGWCQLRYMPKLAEFRGRLADIPFDFHELIGTLAPRTISVIAPLHDGNFRSGSVDRIIEAARPVFALHGAGDRLHVEHPDCGHDFPLPSRERAYDLIQAAARPIRIGVFEVDATPPVGSPMAYDPVKEVESPLSCRGIVIVGNDKPIVLCAVDWIGIGNGAHRFFREQLAQAARTTPDRVSVHTLHQHDAPWCDFDIDALLSANGLAGRQFDSAWARTVMTRATSAVREAVAGAQPVTHVGVGGSKVEKVASNRRIPGPDGKIRATRYTATKDPALRAEPEGLIDPELKLIAFFNDTKPVAALTFYATHPQSYYRTGKANPDFPGMARNQRQAKTGTPHIHFNGAGGNIGAGKYNDGSPENRPVLAGRMEDAMTRAWAALKLTPITAADLGWTTQAVALPPSRRLDDAALATTMRDSSLPMTKRTLAGAALVFSRRCRAGVRTDLGCLQIRNVRLLTMPGELFVEYQLAAQKMRPDLFIAMAAYGDYGPAYIGTKAAYDEGGYETLPTSSFVAPEVESVLLDAMRALLQPAKH